MSHPAPISAETLLSHADSLRALARSLLRDEDAAEDVVQETWVAALERPPARCPSTASVGGWLHVVARHIALKRARGEASRAMRERAGARPEPVASAAGVAERKALVKDVVDAVMALPEPYQSVVYLRYFEGLPPRALARELARPILTVRSQLSRGLALLRRRLDAEYGGDRTRWTGAPVALAGSGRPAATLASTKTAGVGGAGTWLGALLMTTNLKIAGVAVVAAGLLWWLAGVESETPTLEVAPVPAEVVSARRPAPAVEELVASARHTPAAVVVPEAVERTAPPAVPEPEPSAVELPPFSASALAPVDRRFTSELSLELVSLRIASRPADLGGEAKATVFADQELVVTDVPFPIGFGGRPGLLRTYDVVRCGVNATHLTSGGVGPEATRLVGRSVLQGQTVEFRWDAGSGAWDSAFAPSAGASDPPPDELLAGLVHDLDLGVFAPPPGAAFEETWSIEPRALRSWLAPGGDLGLELEAADPSVLGPKGFWSLGEAMEDAEGTVTARLAASGPAGAEIALEFELDLRHEEPLEFPDGAAPVTTAKVLLAYVLAGTARIGWDEAAQRVSRLDADADVRLRMTIAGVLGQDGAGLPEVACELEGTARWEVESKARPADESDGDGR